MIGSKIPTCKKIKVLLETWKILKKDLDILKQVMEYTTPFHENHIQEKIPKHHT